MKKLILFVPLFLFAQIAWLHDFQKAKKLSKQTNKPLFVFIERTVPACQWCEKMKHTTLEDENISDFINSHFIPVLVDKNSPNYPQALRPRYVPTIYIIQNNRIIKTVVGYWGKKDFQSDLADIKRVLNTNSK